MNDTASKFKDQQKLLSDQFAQRANSDADRLDLLVVDLPNDNRIQSLEEMRHLAHRLSGGAGIFGFNEITEPAGVLENSIDVNGSDIEIQENTKALTQIIREAVQPRINQ